ncbi:MAG: hypothetical protein ACOX5G_03515 [Kiritimatiellia bacterium]|jgi:hypothetical protein
MFGLLPLSVLIGVTVLSAYLLTERTGMDGVAAWVLAAVLGVASLHLYWLGLKLLGAWLDRREDRHKKPK